MVSAVSASSAISRSGILRCAIACYKAAIKLRRTPCFGRQGGCWVMTTEAPLRVMASLQVPSSAQKTDSTSPDAKMQWRRCFLRTSHRRMGKLLPTGAWPIPPVNDVWYNRTTRGGNGKVSRCRLRLGHVQREGAIAVEERFESLERELEQQRRLYRRVVTELIPTRGASVPALAAVGTRYEGRYG